MSKSHLAATEFAKHRISINCIGQAVFSLYGRLWRSSRSSDRRDHAGASPCRARGAADHYSRCDERTSRRIIRILQAGTLPELQGQMTFGSSLAADLMLIWVFVVVDVAIPFDDDFTLLAVLA